MSKMMSCPRCGDHAYEKLKTYSCCYSCNYTPETADHWKYDQENVPIPSWAMQALKEIEMDRVKRTRKVSAIVPKKGSAA